MVNKLDSGLSILGSKPGQAPCIVFLGKALKSSRPKFSPGGVQDEKIENPQTLSEYRS